eukprot:765433-Hanusia_phi.AAC.2
MNNKRSQELKSPMQFYEDRSPGERPPLYDGMLELPAMKTVAESSWCRTEAHCGPAGERAGRVPALADPDGRLPLPGIPSCVIRGPRTPSGDAYSALGLASDCHSWCSEDLSSRTITSSPTSPSRFRSTSFTRRRSIARTTGESTWRSASLAACAVRCPSPLSLFHLISALPPALSPPIALLTLRLQPSTLAACHTVEDQQPSSTRCDPAKEREDATGGVDKDTVRAILSSLVESVLDRVMEQEDTVPQMKQEPDAKQEQVSGSAEQEGDDSLGNCEYCTVKAEDVSFVDMFG